MPGQKGWNRAIAGIEEECSGRGQNRMKTAFRRIEKPAALRHEDIAERPGERAGWIEEFWGGLIHFLDSFPMHFNWLHS